MLEEYLNKPNKQCVNFPKREIQLTPSEIEEIRIYHHKTIDVFKSAGQWDKLPKREIPYISIA